MSENGTRRAVVLGLAVAVIPLLVALLTFADLHRGWVHEGGSVVAPGPVTTRPPAPGPVAGPVVLP
jgi:hypothetical protein